MFVCNEKKLFMQKKKNICITKEIKDAHLMELITLLFPLIKLIIQLEQAIVSMLLFWPLETLKLPIKDLQNSYAIVDNVQNHRRLFLSK